MKKKENPAQHLGDGVYAKIEHGMVRLTTAGTMQSESQTIYLEEGTAINLMQYIQKWIWVTHHVTVIDEGEDGKPKFVYKPADTTDY